MTRPTVLVPLDGSRFSEAALPLALELGCRLGARPRLTLVHTAPAGAGLGADQAALTAELWKEEADYLAAVAERLGPAAAADVAHVSGDPGPALSQESARAGTALVVMATHGRGAVSRFWLGSVADYVVRHASVPLVLVRPHEDGPARERVRLRRLLVPLDPSPHAEAVLDLVGELARPFPRSAGDPAAIELVTVVEPVLGVGEPGLPFAIPADPRLLQEQCRLAEDRLQEVARRLEQKGLAVSWKVLTAARPAVAILEEAEAAQADLLAMTSRGEGRIGRLLLGSVADKVIRGSSVPVLVMRPPGATPGH